MKTTTQPPAAGEAAHNWRAHNTQGVKGWAVAVPHPSGDGSFYAAIAQGLPEADARLLAASPELLAALKLIMETSADEHGMAELNRRCKVAEDAIAKAEGSTP